MKSFWSSIKSGISSAWNWVVFSSADPAKLSLTVKGYGSLAIVNIIFSTVLPALGFHPAFDLNTFADGVSSVVFYGASAITFIAGTIGAFRKLILTAKGQN